MRRVVVSFENTALCFIEEREYYYEDDYSDDDICRDLIGEADEIAREYADDEEDWEENGGFTNISVVESESLRPR